MCTNIIFRKVSLENESQHIIRTGVKDFQKKYIKIIVSKIIALKKILVSQTIRTIIVKQFIKQLFI